MLPRAGTKFIDKTKLLPAAGIPFDALLARKKFDSLSKAFMNRLLKQRLQANTVASSTVSSTAVLNLDFLLESVMREKQALDWDTFIHNEVHQPLRIIASNAKTLSSIALSFDRGHYQDIDSLLKCIRASMLVPGVTDPLLSLENQTFVSMKVIKDIAVIAQNASQSESSAASLMKKIKSMPRWNVPQMIESGTNMTKNAWQDMLNKNATANFKLDSIKTLKVFQAWMAKRPNRPKPLRKWDRKQILDRVSALGPRGMKQYNKAKLQSSLRKNRTAIHTKWQHKNHNLNTFSTNQTTDPSHLCDALLCEPIPYRSAITEADHLIVLRTKPDPCVVLGKGSSVYDIFIAQRFFKEHGADEAVEWIQDLQHQKIYAEDGKPLNCIESFFYSVFHLSIVLLLNEGAKGLVDGINIGNKNIHLLPIAPIGDVTEVSQLETRRENIIYGIRTGARRVLEIFWPILSSSTNSSHEGLSLEDNEVTIDELLDLIVPSVPPKSKDGPNQADIINDLLYSIDSLAESYTTTNGIKL